MKKNSKALAVLSYITWIGWLIAFFARDKEDTLVKCHLNAALFLNLLSSVCAAISRIGGVIGIIGSVGCLVFFVISIMGIVRAVKMSEEPLPIIGSLKLIK
ncbi:MAG: hypothetical protein K6F54_05285 [Lachnospiraceae bacterium]|nr:hypothetical protein [Lachnospiraceae bacterium]